MHAYGGEWGTRNNIIFVFACLCPIFIYFFSYHRRLRTWQKHQRWSHWIEKQDFEHSSNIALYTVTHIGFNEYFSIRFVSTRRTMYGTGGQIEFCMLNKRLLSGKLTYFLGLSLIDRSRVHSRVFRVFSLTASAKNNGLSEVDWSSLQCSIHSHAK